MINYWFECKTNINTLFAVLNHDIVPTPMQITIKKLPACNTDPPIGKISFTQVEGNYNGEGWNYNADVGLINDERWPPESI